MSLWRSSGLRSFIIVVTSVEPVLCDWAHLEIHMAPNCFFFINWNAQWSCLFFPSELPFGSLCVVSRFEILYRYLGVTDFANIFHSTSVHCRIEASTMNIPEGRWPVYPEFLFGIRKVNPECFPSGQGHHLIICAVTAGFVLYPKLQTLWPLPFSTSVQRSQYPRIFLRSRQWSHKYIF